MTNKSKANNGKFTISIELTQDEWNTITAALLALHDYDDNRGNTKGALDAYSVRSKVRYQLAISAYVGG